MNFGKIVFAVALFFFLCNCSTPKTQQQSMFPSFDKEGHRGCRGLMPENTIPAMLKALDLGVTTLEMDASVTKDQKVILSHEPFFNHEISTKPDGTPVTIAEEKELNIYKMNYEETRRYDVGLRPHPRFPDQQKIPATKPLLEAIIDSAEAHAVSTHRPLPFYNIETKTNPATDNIYHPGPEEFVRLLMNVIKKKGIESRVIIQSFDFRTLRIIHTKYPGIKTAALIEEGDHKTIDEHIKELGFNPDIYSPHFSLVNPAMVNDCHSRHIKLLPWTVNDRDQIKSLRALGVDGIITDFPNLFE